MLVFQKKPTLSERNPIYLQIMWVFLEKKTLYLKETHIIWSDNVSFLDKPILSADKGKNLVYLR